MARESVDYIPLPEHPVADFNEELLPPGSLTTLRAKAIEELDPQDPFGPNTYFSIPNIGGVFVEDCLERNVMLHYEIIQNPRSDLYGLEPDRAVEIAKEHYKKLHELGATVVSHTIEQRTDLSEDEQKQPNVPQILRAYKFVENTDLAYRIPINDLSPELMVTSVLRPVQAYLRWCYQTKQPFFLPDVTKTTDYRYHYESDTVFYDKPRPDLWFGASYNREIALEDYFPRFRRAMEYRRDA